VIDEAPKITPEMLARMMQQMQDQQAKMVELADQLAAQTEANQELHAKLDEAEGHRRVRRSQKRADDLSPEAQWMMAEREGGLLG
jgi:hypothetical protein